MSDSRLSDSIFGGDDERQNPAAVGSARRSAARRPGGSHPVARHPGQDRRAPLMSRGNAGRSCLALLLLMVLGLGGAGYALSKLVGRIGPIGGSDEKVELPDYAGSGSGSVDITVNPGDSGLKIGKTLETAGVVKSANAFAALAGGDPRFNKIQAGTYHLKHQMSTASAIDLMLQPGSRVSGGTVVREGLWAQEIYQILADATGTPVADYAKVDPSTLNLPPAAGGKVEGYLFPATYIFPKKSTAQQQLKMMVDQGNQARAVLDIPAARLHDVMTTASIVQGEAGAADMGKVARVIANRLQPGNTETNGRLQMDSTIHYILKKRGTSKVSLEDTKVASPYNTYGNAGLPPGPINNPGLAAIKAALNPTPGPWYYFVTVDMDSGKTLFATSLGEQQANEGQYRAWCSSHPGRC